MGLNSRGRGRGNFQAQSHREDEMTDQKPLIRSTASSVYGPPAGFFGRPAFNFGQPRLKFGKSPRKNFKGKFTVKNNGVFQHEIDLTKPWVTDYIKNEEIKKHEFLQIWKNTKNHDDWNNFIVQKQSLHLLYKKAKADYAANHPNEAIFQENVSHVKQYYCETCDKSFRDNDGLIIHVAGHETCGRDGCNFTAHPKIIAKHIKMQHASGLYKRIGKLYTEEDIAKWIEERKKRYPTRKVVEEKKNFEQEKLARGERIKLNDCKFNKLFQKKNKNEKKKLTKKSSHTDRNQRRKKRKKTSVAQMYVKEAYPAIRKGVPAFLGIKNDNNLEVSYENHLDISDEEWEAEQTVIKPLFNNSLGLLAALYDSDEQNQDENIYQETKIEYMSFNEESGPEEIKTVSSKRLSPLPKEELGVTSKKLLDCRKENQRKRKKKSFNDSNVEKKETRVVTLLEKLLKNEIRHERNVILQCIHYVVDNARTYRQGELLAAFLSYRHSHSSSKRLKVPNMESVVTRVLDSPYDELVIFHLKCLNALDEKNVLEAFRNQYELVLSFVKLFQSQKEENWMLKVMQIICLELRLLATPADKQANNKKHPHECLEKTAKALMACFRICAADNRSSEQDTKKWGMLTLVNQMFKVYFKINRHQLCKPLMRAIDSSNLKDRFALAQIITYKFFAGQRAMFDGDFKTANECLSFAFLRCHRNSPKNKRSILLYLVPVKMILGYMPKKKLLEKYNLLEFWNVVEAVKMGNIQKFNEVMEQYREFFVRHNIYVIMQRLSTIATRNLIKKVYHIVNSHQIPVEMFLKALLAMKIEDASWDEAECLLANLILEGKVKGYISYQHDTLVVSKLTPFPMISSLK